MSAETTPLTTDDVPDEIVRSIHVEASAETVCDGARATVVDPVHGEFQLEVVALDPPRRAVFRWLGGDAGSLEDFPSNTVEFTIEDQEVGVRLTVRETGFAGLDEDAAARRARFESNDSGWVEELGVAKAQAEQRTQAEQR